MRKKMMNLKGVNVMTKEQLKGLLAGSAPDCEEGFVPVDGICLPEHTTIDEGNLPGSTIDDCPMY